MNRGQLAADIHRRMVEDNRFGYSWEERWGALPETWTVDGVKVTINVGDYDCSSSTITAWKLALAGTPWAEKLDGASFTGNMRGAFVSSGLFEWKPMSFTAEPGDLYLNESSHVAMCQPPGTYGGRYFADPLSEFCWGDNGAYGNRRGDQSGTEAVSGAFYNYPWDGILHYNHKADSATTPTKPTKEEEEPMTFLFEPDGKKEVWFYDCGHVVRLTNRDHVKAIQMAHKKATGKECPYFKFGEKKAPWAARFAQCFENRAARNGVLDNEYKMKGWTV